MKESIKVVNKSAVNENDKMNCFARISAKECNALKKKECSNCSFYKCKEDIKNYESILKTR